MKFYLALRGDCGKFHTTEYIAHKLNQILKDDTDWHPLVHKFYEENKHLLHEKYGKKDND